MEVLHISIGVIVDESRGSGRQVSYEVSSDSYKKGPELQLVGITEDENVETLIAPVLPIVDLFVTKLLPVGRQTDMVDATLLIVSHPEELQTTHVVDKIRERPGLIDVALERLEAFAEFVRQQELGGMWLGRMWSRADRERVLRFIREIESRVKEQ